MKRISFILIGLILLFNVDVSAKKGGNGNGNGGNANAYTTSSDFLGDFEDSNAWENNNIPTDFLNIDEQMTINGTVTRNGNLNPVTTVVNDTFYVYGDYFNNQGEGLSVSSAAVVEIYGDLLSNKDVSVAKDGILIVHGNFSSTGGKFQSNGNVIVTGDFLTSSDTQIQNKGNLVVGGDFDHSGGDFTSKSDDVYILNPDANINYDGEYGNIDDFLVDENNSDLLDLVDKVVINPINLWLGKTNSDWFEASNWKNRQVPGVNSSVKIESSIVAPVFNGDETIANLTISENASVVIKSGATLEISSTLINNGMFILDNDFGKAPAAMIPPVDNKDAGKADIFINGIPANAWIKLGHPVKSPKASIYNVGGTEKVDSWIYRVFNGWQQIQDPELELKEMGGINAWFAPKDGSSTYDLNYQGVINTGEVSYNVEGGGYYLLSNPFTSAIDWAKVDGKGWDRSENVSGDIYHRVHIGNGISDYEFVYNGKTGVSQVVNAFGFTPENVSHIAPLSSVWIKVENSAPAHVKVDNKARVRSTVPLKNASAAKKNYEKIRVISKRNEILLDGAVLYFDNAFDKGIDFSDSQKKLNSSKELPEIYFNVENKRLSLNGVPELQEENYEFALSVRNRVEGEVTLSFNFDDFSGDYEAFLEDRESGSWTNLGVNNDYVYSPIELGENHDRFVIHLKMVKNEVVTSVEDIENESIQGIYINGFAKQVQVGISNSLFQSANNASIEVLDTNGRLIQRQVTNNTESEIALPEQNGVYIVRVIVGGTVKTEKFVR